MSQRVKKSGCQRVRVFKSQSVKESECQRVRVSKSQSVKESECQRVRVSESQGVKESGCQRVRASKSQGVKESGCQRVWLIKSQIVKESGCHRVRELIKDKAKLSAVSVVKESKGSNNSQSRFKTLGLPELDKDNNNMNVFTPTSKCTVGKNEISPFLLIPSLKSPQSIHNGLGFACQNAVWLEMWACGNLETSFENFPLYQKFSVSAVILKSEEVIKIKWT